MKTRIDKKRLKEKLTENLAKHDHVLNEALEAYWENLTRDFNKQVRDARKIIASRDISFGAVSLNVHISVPVSYKESYEEALSMLEYEKDDSIELSEKEFKAYVLNKWDWESNFLISNAMYASADTVSAFSGTA